MYTIKGLSVSHGIGIGRARIIKERALTIDDYSISAHEIEANLEKFEQSIGALIKEIDEFVENFDISKIDESIIETHKMILLDPDLLVAIDNLVRNEKRNVEQAVYLHFTRTIDYFKNLDNEFYAERAVDYEDVYRRLIKHLMKVDNDLTDNVEAGDIVVINEIPPSMVSQLHQKKIAGLVLLKGTRTSHSVIIARAYGIPIITTIKYIHQIHEHDTLIIDAKEGFVICNPDENTLNEYIALQKKINNEADELQKYKEHRAVIDVKILSNIELPMEVNSVLELNSDGIGLFRTEFLYLNRKSLPTEEEQFDEYKMIAERLGEREFVIRTIDVGGDKVAGWYSTDKEMNPYLGCRGIRFSLKYKSIFVTQLRAILRASAYGNIQIMFPMIATVEEFLEAKSIFEECKDELRKENIPFKDDIKVGTMIEVPSAAICSEALAMYSDFFSIGTNDLLQYTVAVDRNNDSISKYYNPYNPAFLQLIQKTIKSGVKHGKPVAVCGELASDVNFTVFLLCSGVRELSVGIEHILPLRKRIGEIDKCCSGVCHVGSHLDELEKCMTTEQAVEYINRLNEDCEIHS
jgi:phosphotransferase system enzyme I (PtsI)